MNFKSPRPKPEQDPKLNQFFVFHCDISCRVAYIVKLQDSLHLEKLLMGHCENFNTATK